jgi:hypothetical protein
MSVVKPGDGNLTWLGLGPLGKSARFLVSFIERLRLALSYKMKSECQSWSMHGLSCASNVGVWQGVWMEQSQGAKALR